MYSYVSNIESAWEINIELFRIFISYQLLLMGFMFYSRLYAICLRTIVMKLLKQK